MEKVTWIFNAPLSGPMFHAFLAILSEDAKAARMLQDRRGQSSICHWDPPELWDVFGGSSDKIAAVHRTKYLQGHE